jgi:hypothetical protein
MDTMEIDKINQYKRGKMKQKVSNSMFGKINV